MFIPEVPDDLHNMGVLVVFKAPERWRIFLIAGIMVVFFVKTILSLENNDILWLKMEVRLRISLTYVVSSVIPAYWSMFFFVNI